MHEGTRCTVCKRPIEPMMMLKHFLGRRTIQEVRKSIRRYEGLDLRNLNDKQLAAAIRAVLMKEDEQRRAVLLIPAIMSAFREGRRFSRVRRLSYGDVQRMLREGLNEQRDCYEPPPALSHAIGPGRLNHPKERVLYTAYGGAGWATMACFEELDIKENEWFMIVEYEATEPFSAVQIGPERFTPPERKHELNDEEREKSEILLRFVRDKFQQRITEDNDHLYRITRLIAREFSLNPSPNPKIWMYPSIARDGGWNVAFDPAQKDKLRVKDIKIAECRAYNRDLGARLIVIRYDAVDDHSEPGRRRLLVGAGPQAHFALTYAHRVEKTLSENVSFIERVKPEQNDQIMKVKGQIVLAAEQNDEGGTYISARGVIGNANGAIIGTARGK